MASKHSFRNFTNVDKDNAKDKDITKKIENRSLGPC